MHYLGYHELVIEVLITFFNVDRSLQVQQITRELGAIKTLLTSNFGSVHPFFTERLALINKEN